MKVPAALLQKMSLAVGVAAVGAVLATPSLYADESVESDKFNQSVEQAQETPKPSPTPYDPQHCPACGMG